MFSNYIPALVNGLGITLLITMLSIVFGTLGGIILGVLSFMKSPLRILARIYIEIFLGIPVLVLLIWIYYVLPEISQSLIISPFWTAVLSMVLSASAFIAEIINGGLRSVPKGQMDAALMLGISKSDAIRHIVLPQSIQTMWPALIMQYITTYKLVPLASTIGVMEILHTGSLIIHQTYKPIVVYSIIALFFLVTVYPLNLLARLVQERHARKELLHRV